MGNKCVIGSGFTVSAMSYYWKLHMPERWRGCTFTWLEFWILVTYTSSEIWINPSNLWILGWDYTDWTALHPQYLANNRVRGTEVYILYVVFTARKRSCGKVMFLHLSVSHSVHRGALHPGGLHPRGLLPGFVCIQGDLHPEAGSASTGSLHPGGSASRRVWADPPPPIGYHRIRSTSGRYASYWNAFLFSLYLYLFMYSSFLFNYQHRKFSRKSLFSNISAELASSEWILRRQIDKFEMTEKTWHKHFHLSMGQMLLTIAYNCCSFLVVQKDLINFFLYSFQCFISFHKEI